MPRDLVLMPTKTFSAAIIAWQQLHGRHQLPWQHTRDAYLVWLSEIMLQQTQVSTVTGYYQRFIGRFPDVQSLAAGSLDEVLALWSGLGYYSRARSLHRCAQEIVQSHGGRFPDDAAALAALPGIGRSTAAAIAVICFGRREAILDGNVKRVLTRVLGFDADLSQAAGERALWLQAEALLPRQAVDVYTQGLMDLGATVCVARRPLCAACPVEPACVAHAQGEPERYPVKTRRTRRGERRNVLLLLTHRREVMLVQRPAQGVWGGLWSLPEFDGADALANATAGLPGDQTPMTAVRHALTHFDWMLQPIWHRLPERPGAAQQTVSRWPEGRWVPTDRLGDVGLPAPVRSMITTISSLQ